MSLPITTSLRSGDLLDHYRLECLVASGGMASVFRATDTKTGRRVAVKVPHPNKVGSGFALDRFRSEIEIGRKLDHPGLVKLLSDDRGSTRYLVMEWVEGQLLREIIDNEEKLPIERAIRIALAICDALEYVHARGIVHRDLKPENVIICGIDRVKLIDFGIAHKSGLGSWKPAKFREAMGTPDYMAPEQIKGKPGDARSDVYSLGMILFEMMTGEVPFSGLDPITAMNLRLVVDPPLAGEINPDVPPGPQDIVHRALARDPADRYAGAREFASDLAESLAEEKTPEPLESLAGF